MIATDAFGIAAPLIVRIAAGGSWQLDASKYLRLDIDLTRGLQRVLGRTRLATPDLPVIHAWLDPDGGSHRYFICPEWIVQAIVYRTHRRWLRGHGWARPRKPDSTHCALWPRDLESFEGDWDLLFEQIASARAEQASDAARRRKAARAEGADETGIDDDGPEIVVRRRAGSPLRPGRGASPDSPG